MYDTETLAIRPDVDGRGSRKKGGAVAGLGVSAGRLLSAITTSMVLYKGILLWGNVYARITDRL